jgi:hypothetical protein
LKAATRESKKIEINLNTGGEGGGRQQTLLSKHGNTHIRYSHVQVQTHYKMKMKRVIKERKIYRRVEWGGKTDKKERARQQLGSCFSYTAAVITSAGRKS